MKRYFLFAEWKAGLRTRPILTILVVLFAAGGIVGVVTLHLGLENASRWWESRFNEPQLEVFLDPAITDSGAMELADRLRLIRQVQDAHYASAEQARREAEEYLGPLAFSVLPENPLPPSIRLTLKSEYRTPYASRRLADSLMTISGITETVSADELLAAYGKGRGVLNRYRDSLLVTALLWIVGWLFLGTFMVLRIRSNHAAMWRYLGVPPGWLRWPPIAEGLTLGCCAAMIGMILIVPAVRSTHGAIKSALGLGEYAALLGAPPIIGALAGWLAYRVHRRCVFRQ